MKNSFAFIAVVVFVSLVTACTPTEEILFERGEVQAERVFTTVLPTPTFEAADTLTQPDRPAVEPDIPKIVDTLNFGLPAGNGDHPYRIAVDSQRRRLYAFNQGLSSSKVGNTISVIELDTEQVTALIELNNLPAEATYPPSPLALQVDPYRPRLYALWGDSFGDSASTTLTIIDTETLNILDTLPGIGAIAPGPEQLYLVNETRLWTVDPLALTELNDRQLDLRQFNRPLRLNLEANRLYLGRGAPWSVEVFMADSLTPIGSYPAADELLGIVPDPARRRLLVVHNEDARTILRGLDLDGQPLPEFEPITLSNQITYGTLPLAATEQTLYFSRQNLDTYTYHLYAYPLSDLSPLADFPLPTLPNDLTADPATGYLYAVYSSPASYLLQIDPATGEAETIYTATDLIAALADPGTNRLYVLMNQGTLQILGLTGYDEIAQAETGFNTLKGASSYNGELSLDPGRQRLYISGDPIHTVDTDTLQATPHPDLQGQITPAPTGDKLYLTPSCRCRLEQCNTLILKADTMTGTDTLFPPEDPLSAPCVTKTTLDDENQLLYATIDNGIPGSNSGNYLTVFNAQTEPPKQLYTDGRISYGDVAIDPLGPRAFVPRYRMDRSYIHRLEAQGRTITETLTLAGAQGELIYDPAFDRLYAVADNSLQVFDGDLALLIEISLPGEFELLTFDPQGQRLYLHGRDAQMLIVATGGGQLEPPPPEPVTTETDDSYVQKLVVAPNGTRFRLASSTLYRSRAQGQTWQRLGQGLPNHLVNDLALSPNYEQDQTLLAGLWSYGRSGGLYRSTDGGDTWQPTTRGLTDLEIQQIVFSPTFTQDQTIFVTTLAHGLFRSTDEGNTWDSLAANYAHDSVDRKVSHVAVSPTFATDGLVIIGYNTLLRSSNGGQTWIDTGLPAGLTAFSPNFAKDGLILSVGRWRSTDRGQSWQPAAAGLEPAIQTRTIFFSPNFAVDQTVYILQQPDYRSLPSLQRSIDAGRTWQSLSGGLPADFDLTAATILPGGELYLNGRDGQDLIISSKMLSWSRPAVDITQLDLQTLSIAPNGDIFVANSAAGVFKSMDGGRTWQETDFPARASDVQAARLAVAADGTLFAAVGTALERSPDGGHSWTHLPNLPAGFTVASLAVSPDFTEDGLVLVGGTYNRNQLLRSTDRGESWEVVFDGDSIGSEFASDLSLIAFSPNFGADGQVYAWLQEGGLLRSTDGGGSWTLVAEEYGQYFGQTLAVDPTGDRLYLGGLGGRLLSSTDRGETWTDLTDNIPGSRMWSSALAFRPNRTIFLGTDIGIYRSLDEGQTWTEVNAGLPLDPIQNTPISIRALEFEGTRLYAALTEGGLFISDDGGQSWQSTVAGEPDSAAQISPMATPTTSVPSPASPAECATSPAYFTDVWAERVAQLGCPTGAHRVTMVEQTFEGGRMFWRSDLTAIYALPTGQPYARFDDTWDETQPAYTCPDFGPAQTPPTPQRGFGKVWCAEASVRAALGKVTSQERPFAAALQEFETGLIFQLDGQATYLLESQSNGWERLE